MQRQIRFISRHQVDGHPGCGTGADVSIASRLALVASGVPSKRTLALVTVTGQFFKQY
jgi:hypothetical protein